MYVLAEKILIFIAYAITSDAYHWFLRPNANYVYQKAENRLFCGAVLFYWYFPRIIPTGHITLTDATRAPVHDLFACRQID